MTEEYIFKNFRAAEANYLMPYSIETGLRWQELPHVITFLDHLHEVLVREGLAEGEGPNRRLADNLLDVNLRLLASTWPLANIDQSIILMHCQHDDDSMVVTTSQPIYRDCVATPLWLCIVESSPEFPEKNSNGINLDSDVFFEDNELHSWWQPLNLDFLWCFVRPARKDGPASLFKVVGTKREIGSQTVFVPSPPNVELHELKNWFGAPTKKPLSL